MKSGIELITEERVRQVTVEEWSAEHDFKHKRSELALAAVAYALPDNLNYENVCGEDFERSNFFPFHHSWFKEGEGLEGRIRELSKAGALIAAEIDRLNYLSVNNTEGRV
jgi:hypothetical protein